MGLAAEPYAAKTFSWSMARIAPRRSRSSKNPDLAGSFRLIGLSYSGGSGFYEGKTAEAGILAISRMKKKAGY